MPLGITSCCYVNTGVSYASPTWSLLDLISDLVPKTDWNEGDASVRRGRVVAMEPTNLLLELAGKIRKDISNLAYIKLRTSHRDAAVVDMLVLDGPNNVNGSDGVRFDAKVFQWSEDQGLQAVIFKDFTIKPCIPVNGLPQSVLVAGSVPVYTAFGP